MTLSESAQPTDPRVAVSKRLVLEKLVMDLTTESKAETAGWMQEQLPV